MRMAVVGAPAYFAAHPRPQTPAGPGRTQLHQSAPAHPGGLYAWEFGKGGRELGCGWRASWSSTTRAHDPRGRVAGLGLACVHGGPGRRPTLADGALIRVLEDWCPPFAGYHLYYPSRRQPSAGLRAAGRGAALSGGRNLN